MQPWGAFPCASLLVEGSSYAAFLTIAQRSCKSACVACVAGLPWEAFPCATFLLIGFALPMNPL